MVNPRNKARNSDQHQQQQNLPEANHVVDEDMDVSDDEEGGTRIGGIYIPPPVKAYCSTESKGPRLIIRFIENTNFKSYANTVRVGPFHHRFSAVIGPNGSGKSNVIDSMLFVFGYRAQQIRSKKLSVLIHNSSKYPNVNSCKVAVHFQQIVDKEDGTFDLIPNTEIVIARTAFKNNSSFYSVGQREVKFKDVAKILEEHNIDLLHNRFLILQGEVESIAMMKPKVVNTGDKGLLEYLEDIIGTERYKKPLFLINERLEKLNEERTEKHNRCRLAEREMKDLELPMTQAVEYLKLENKMYQAKNLHLQLYIHNQKKTIASCEIEKGDAAKVLKEHDESFEEHKKQRREKEKIVEEELKKHDDMSTKVEEFKNFEKKALTSYQRVDAKMKATNIRRKDLKKQVDADQKKLEELQTLPDRNNKEIEESQKQIERHTAEKEELDKKLAENLQTISNDTKPLQDKKVPLEVDLGTLKADLDKLKAEYSEAEKELEILEKDETNENRKYESLRHSLGEVKQQLQEKQKLLEDAGQAIPEMKEQLVEKQQQVKELQASEKEVQEELRKTRLKLDENRSNMQMAQSHNRVLNALMKEKQKGNIPGILGRLGDLGGIDAKYDVAISTCCGRLDNIIVEDVATAQKCIQFLKDNNVGRGNFIALEKIGHFLQRYNQKRTYPQNVPRLVDLIRVEDQRVIPAFYYALNETLVANNMEQASAIAYGQTRYRVVTLTGEVIEMTGTMSGGGKSLIKGKMGQKVQTKSAPTRLSMSDKDLENLSQRAQNYQGRLNDIQHQVGSLEEEIKKLTVTIRQKEQELSRFQLQIKSFAEQIPRLEDQVAKQKKRADSTKADAAKTAALREKVDECKISFQTKEDEVEQIQSQVTALNKQIKEISDKKVKEPKTKIEKIAKQIDTLTKNVNRLNVEINTTDRNIQKAEERIEQAKNDITEAENSMRKMAEEREQFKVDGEELAKKIEQLNKELAEATSDQSAVKKEIAQLVKEEADAKIKRLELDDNFKTLEKKLKELLARIPQWENKIKTLALHEIPNEEMPDPPFKSFTGDELENKSIEDTQYEITQMEEKLASDKPNLGSIEEFNKKRAVYMERIKVLEDVTVKRNEMREAFDSVKKKRFTEFTEGFQIISRKLKEMYQMITLGGDAELELVDSMDPFTEGIVFSVRPPKKSWKVITNLSGGEKTLSSLALVFALHYYKPSPLYFMDEIDAALDFKNVSIVANYINERTKNAQFIIISLRSNMFELADYLVGIYKVEDCTHSLTIQNFDKQRVLGIGEKESEKENFSANLSLSPSPEKNANLTQQQPMEKSGLSENMELSQHIESTQQSVGVSTIVN